MPRPRRPRMLPNGRSPGGTPPFAMLRCADLATSSVCALARDHPVALRLWLYANAAWRPDVPIALPARATMKALRIRAETFASATATLIAAGLLIRTREASRPGAAGGAAGIAAEYDLPHRRKGAFLPRSPGDPEPMGAILADADRLRDLVARLTPTAARVWLVAASQPRHGKKQRSAWGTPTRPFVFNAAALAADLSLSRSSVYDALALLRALGEAEISEREDGTTELQASGTLATGKKARKRIVDSEDGRFAQPLAVRRPRRCAR